MFKHLGRRLLRGASGRQGGERRRKRRVLALGALVTIPFVTQNCEPPFDHASEYKHNIAYDLRHDFSLSPGIRPGFITSCYITRTTAEGRDSMCRVIWDHEEQPNSPQLGSHEEFYVDGYPYNDRDEHPSARILRSSGRSDSRYGQAIWIQIGQHFMMLEGCAFHSVTGNYTCDHEAYGFSVLHADRQWQGWFLRRLWEWSGSMASISGCAGGVLSVWSGAAAISPWMLRECLDGPM